MSIVVLAYEEFLNNFKSNLQHIIGLHFGKDRYLKCKIFTNGITIDLFVSETLDAKNILKKLNVFKKK